MISKLIEDILSLRAVWIEMNQPWIYIWLKFLVKQYRKLITGYFPVFYYYKNYFGFEVRVDMIQTSTIAYNIRLKDAL